MAYKLVVFAAFLAIIFYRLRNVGRRPKGYPPGPPTLPLIGNLHQVPHKDSHHQFKKWAEEYGDVYSLILGTKVMIVISSDTAVKDLLDKRSSIYSSRPEMFLGSTVASGGLRVVLMQYGEQWRMIRKIMHTILHIKASQGYVPYQDLENKHMLCGFLDQPDDFINHIRRFTNSLTMQMVYGFRIVSNDDEKLQRLYETFERWSQVVGSATAAFLDVYPSLRSLPVFMLPTLRFAQRAYKDTTDLYLGHWLDAKKRVLGGTSKPCFCVGIVESQITAGFSEDIAGYISGTILEAGSDTTSASLIGFVQAMVLYPAAQKQAQDEVDRVCGTDRLPSIEDWDDMPYIRACIKESLRWMPTAVMGIPHAVTQDDEYRGYKIPKGAGVTLNVWAIHMDDKRHSEPRTFDPSHYIGDDQTSAESAMNGDASQRDQFVFGAGRRLCQGMHIADRSMFLAISRLLWAFNFDKAVDAHGAEITPDQDDLMEGILTRPSSFPAKITPRSEKHAQMLRDEWDECRILLDEDEQWRDIPKGMVFKSELSEDLKS